MYGSISLTKEYYDINIFDDESGKFQIYFKPRNPEHIGETLMVYVTQTTAVKLATALKEALIIANVKGRLRGEPSLFIETKETTE